MGVTGSHSEGPLQWRNARKLWDCITLWVKFLPFTLHRSGLNCPVVGVHECTLVSLCLVADWFSIRWCGQGSPRSNRELFPSTHSLHCWNSWSLFFFHLNLPLHLSHLCKRHPHSSTCSEQAMSGHPLPWSCHQGPSSSTLASASQCSLSVTSQLLVLVASWSLL